jgi:hypothetical protein
MPFNWVRTRNATGMETKVRMSIQDPPKNTGSSTPGCDARKVANLDIKRRWWR